VIKCPNCGTMNEAGSRFCFQCGQTLASDAGASNGGRTQPISLPGFPSASSNPGSTGPVSGFPPSAPPVGFPQSPGYPPDPYAAGGAYGPPGGYPSGTPPGYMIPPEPPRRRRWLWIILGILLGCILVCVAFGIWGVTAGDGRVERWATEFSDLQTEQANT